MQQIAYWQGLYPPSPLSISQLANGTNITSPLNGFQYIVVNGIQTNNSVSLEGPYHPSVTDLSH